MRSSSAAQAEWQKCLEAEKRLKVALRKQSFYDAEPRALRAQLRAGYEALLFLDPSFASANDVEQALWKGVYYRPIEEFRARMRKAEQAGEPAREQLARTVAAFLKFLDDAAAFYRRLVTQLQTVYGDVGARLSELAAPSAAAGAPAGGGAASAAAAALCAAAAAALAARQQPGGAAAAAAGLGAAVGDGASGSAPRDPRSSVHRSLIYLGDLHRYAAQAAPKAIALGVLPPPPAPSPGGGPPPVPGRADFHRAAACYKMAARVLPRSGNPFNQLAVMAYYANDELRAVYYYFRSLSVSSPFLAARENLLLLLEHNRTKVAELPPPPPEGPSRSANQLALESAHRFIRVAGILFDRINAEDWPRATSAAFATLRGFLAHPGAREQLQRQPRADAIPIHLVVIAVFGVHNAAEAHPRGGGGGGAPAPAAAAVAERAGGSRAEAGQKVLSRSRALAAALRVGATLCHAAAEWCAQAGPTSPGTPHLLIACHVLLQWLAAHPSYAVAGPALAALGAAGGASAAAAAAGLEPAAAAAVAAAAADEALGRAELWDSMARLVPALAAVAPEAAAAWRAKRGAAAAAALPRVGSGPLEDASMEGGPLPEELELLGFQPLRSKHRGQSVGHTVGDSARGVEEEGARRAARIMHEARAVAAALEEEASQLPPGVAADAAAARLLAASRAFVAVAGGGGAGGLAAMGSDAMDVDAPALAARAPAGASFAPPAPHQQQQWQQAPQQRQQQQEEEEEEEGIDVTPEEEEEGIDNTPDGEEEVIVFKPRRAGAIAATATATTAAAAAPPAPPLPQQLLLPRQQAGGVSSGLSSPVAGAAAQPVTLPSKRALGPIPLSVMMAGSSTSSATAGAGGVQLPQRRPAPAVAAAGAALAAGASTEQELQQTHAASAALLARLAARGSGGGSGVPTPPLPGDAPQQQQQAPGYGYGGYEQPQPQHPYLQQQQYYAQQQTPQQSPYVGGSTADWPLNALTQPRTQPPPVPAASGAPAADAADDDGALDEIDRLIAGNRASLELEQTARAAALHILSPGGVGDLAAAAAAGAVRPGAAGGGGAPGLGALLGEAAAVVSEVGGQTWLQQSNHHQQQQQQHLPPPPFPGGPQQQQQPASVLAQLQQQTGRAGGSAGRPLLAASGASSLAGTPRSNASAPAMLPFGAGPAAAPLPAGALSAGGSGGGGGGGGGAGPHPFEGAPRLGPSGLVHIGPTAAGGDLGGLFSAHVGGDIGDGGALGFASGGVLGGTGPASASGYAMFSGPDLFSSAVPRHRRVSSGFGSGRSSAADSTGAPARVSSPGLSLLEHLAAEQATAAAGGGGTLHQQQQQQQAGPGPGPGLPAAPVLQATGSGGLGAFGFGEALFPQSRGPRASVLPPRDAGGAHNPFA